MTGKDEKDDTAQLDNLRLVKRMILGDLGLDIIRSGKIFTPFTPFTPFAPFAPFGYIQWSGHFMVRSSRLNSTADGLHPNQMRRNTMATLEKPKMLKSSKVI